MMVSLAVLIIPCWETECQRALGLCNHCHPRYRDQSIALTIYAINPYTNVVLDVASNGNLAADMEATILCLP